MFESDPDRMALRLPASGELDVFTFAHEYGHYVWFHLLSKDDRSRYESIYNVNVPPTIWSPATPRRMSKKASPRHSRSMPVSRRCLPAAIRSRSNI